MARIKIKQLNEQVATQGLHMGGDDFCRRKLQPGEVVEIPDSIMIENNRLEQPVRLIDMLWDTGLVDMVPDSVPVTRPLDYLNQREAQLCAPNFKSTDQSMLAERDRVRELVQARLDKQAAEPEAKPEPEQPAKPDNPVTQAAPRRRGRRQAANHGEAHTT